MAYQSYKQHKQQLSMHYNHTTKCKHYDDFRQININLKHYYDKNSSGNFSLIHFNIRSLLNKTDDLADFVGDFQPSFDAIAISETWMTDESTHLINIPSYSFIGVHRQQKKGGGVGLYIRDGIIVKTRNEVDILDGLEFLCVEIINNNNSKNIIIIVIYRPPSGNINTFIDSLNLLLAKMTEENKIIIIIGDINIDLNESISPTNKLLQLTQCNNMHAIINVPTRISSKKSSTIDHLFTNYPSLVQYCGTIQSHLSDHLPIFLHLNQQSKTSSHSQTIDINAPKYSYSSSRLANLTNSLASTDWSSIYQHWDVDSMSLNFINLVKKHFFHNCLITSKKKIIKMAKRQPWMTAALKKSSNIKKMLYKKYLQKPTTENFSRFKTYSNKFNSVKNHRKKDYYLEKLRNCGQDSKLTWKVLNEMIKSSQNQKRIDYITINNVEISCPTEICKLLNEYFINNVIPQCVSVSSSLSSSSSATNLSSSLHLDNNNSSDNNDGNNKNSNIWKQYFKKILPTHFLFLQLLVMK